MAIKKLHRRRKVLGGALQSDVDTPATVSTPFANTVIYDAKMEPLDLFADGEAKPDGNYTGTSARTIGPKLGKATWRQELRHADALYLFLQAAGHVVSGAGDLVCKWVSDPTQKQVMTLVLWEGGRRKQLNAAALRPTRFGPDGRGGRVFIEWEAMGLWVDPVAEAMPADATVTTQAYRAKNMTATFDSAAVPPMDGFELDLGITVEECEDMTGDGVGYYLAMDFQPTLRLKPEARLVADYDAYGLLMAGTVQAVVLQLTDGTNTLNMSFPEAQRLNITDETRGETLVDGIELEIQNTGDNAYTFTKSA